MKKTVITILVTIAIVVIVGALWRAMAYITFIFLAIAVFYIVRGLLGIAQWLKGGGDVED